MFPIILLYEGEFSIDHLSHTLECDYTAADLAMPDLEKQMPMMFLTFKNFYWGLFM